jgi:phenylacetate-CoA ligase
LLKFRPAWVMGYSVALDQFARSNVDLANELRAINLKAAIATGESFPRSDSVERIAELFGCRVAMEYGAVESGPIAHQRKNGRFQVFWRHWFMEGEPSRNVPGTFEIFLTSLYPRKFPLMRYQIGDLISDDPNATNFDQTFSRVIGRCNDYIELAEGANIHSEAFTHAVKECESVARFQVIQNGSGKIFFRYVATTNDRSIENEIRRRLSIVHPALSKIEFEKVSSLPLTIAGKTRTIFKEETNERR